MAKRDHRDKPGDDKLVLAGAALSEIGQRLFGEAIELASLGVTLDLAVEARGIERLKPVAEFRELIGRQLGDGLFEVFDGHQSHISRAEDARKSAAVARMSEGNAGELRDTRPLLLDLAAGLDPILEAAEIIDR